MCTEKRTRAFAHHVQNGNRCKSVQRRFCSAVSFLRGRLILATSSALHIRPAGAGESSSEEGESWTRGKVGGERGRMGCCMPKMQDHRYLACDCIVSLQSIEGPFDVLTAEHPEICHEQVSGLHHSLWSHRAQLGVVEQVLGHLERPQHTKHQHKGQNT